MSKKKTVSQVVANVLAVVADQFGSPIDVAPQASEPDVVNPVATETVQMTADEPFTVAPAVETKAPRKGLVDLTFAYRGESAAFIEILLQDPGEEAGRVSWLRKSALKAWSVNEGKVEVTMPRALATRRKFAIAA